MRRTCKVLQSLGDLAGQPLDLFTLPSAMEVKLPQRGSYGVKLPQVRTGWRLRRRMKQSPGLLRWWRCADCRHGWHARSYHGPESPGIPSAR